VKNTICWVLKKGDEVPPFKEYKFRTLFTFPANTKQRFKCNQHLYVSDKRHESHYKRGHRNNRGKKWPSHLPYLYHPFSLLDNDGNVSLLIFELLYLGLKWRARLSLI
jgi:hypothetical protein